MGIGDTGEKDQAKGGDLNLSQARKRDEPGFPKEEITFITTENKG